MEATRLATNELEVTGALSIAVARAVLGTSLVGWVATHTSIGLHSNKVQSAVDATLDGGQINVEGELVPSEGEHLVSLLVLHEIETGANVRAVLMLRDERQSEGIAARGGAVRGIICGPFKSAILYAVGVA